MSKSQSIRSRLLLWIGLPFTMLAILALISSHLLLSRQINTTFDDLLLNAAQRLERRIYTADGELHINMHYFSVSTLGSRGEGKIFYRIKERDGGMIAGFSGLADPPEASQDPTFYDVDYAGNALRAVALTLPYSRGNQPIDIEVVVAESKEARHTLTNDFMVTLTGLMVVTGLLAISIALLAIHWGLAPLNAISQALRQRSPNDLHALNDDAPKEILPLIQSINHLMQRMRRSIESTQQLNADVSHQLRTPISEIRALTEVSLKTNPHSSAHASLREIQRIAEHASHTVKQLLKYAKTRSELVDTSHLEKVDLVAICQDACAQTAPNIYQHSQELAFEKHKEMPNVLGDPIMLRWLVTNLIENASLHAGGSSVYSGVITVALTTNEHQVTLKVSDEGTGVDEAQISKLTERFFRHNKHASGSGLGLAIVEQIAAAHSAQLCLANRPQGGFEVTVIFPVT
ncbi:sensor histidine kinase N-terminal domain-containing protein [Halomonas sp. SpR8]|uniref:sensor histidine kinase N-terminal domain-containing protein n=1 Tax=Halomonas sp. SpR8 TaxID=3050463 RepID=UPI0027E45689|nr:sensor histidine kinase N-terminal domain-containing protein [Halomonas sp. SpR8]MDQ7730388.1 sensor histidine kinase N-terminal domain-containing protein [Halomonas sp. SpR8]